MIRLAVAIFLSLCGVANAQMAGGLQFPGPGTPHSVAAAYQGPGDVVSGATVWGSCARVYTAAQASTSTSLCDLVDSSAPTVTICTLRGSATGFVDLVGTYCTGSVTPATKCAAATGGICNISKVYDQTGTGNHFTNSTAASQPTLSFSALGGLPGMSGTSGAGTVLSSPTITQAQPFTLSIVYERTGNFTSQQVYLGSSAGALSVGSDAVSNKSQFTAGVVITQTATDSVFHAVQAVGNGVSGAMNTDGTDLTAQNAGTNTFSALLRFFRSSGAASSTGFVMEGGLWPSAFNATQRGNVNTNQHSAANGYNF